MSALLLRWLNEELKLKEKVEVLERDASNGYIIAEVLHLQGLEPHLEAYENSPSIAAKIHNMELLGQTFQTLGIPFPVKTRRAIMMEDRSAVVHFMLQLKQSLCQRLKDRPNSNKAELVASVKSTRAISGVARSNHPTCDLEKRFMTSMMQNFHPKDFRFNKDIDMAVHLRKFNQAQWQAESALHNLHQQAKADTDATSAARYAAARTHSSEKARLMRERNQEHYQKWKETQRLKRDAERNNLRLELTYAARRQIYAENRLSESQAEAFQGVNDFEKNMSRLGLSNGAEQPLYSIPESDAGALAHIQNLEKRVENFDFRPSNNVKMMKELRKRRKTQLAAEKDRRMRRQKALADQKKSIKVREMERLQEEKRVDDKNSNMLKEDSISVSTLLEEIADVINPREKYLETKQAELEEHYTRLRDIGSAKREEAMKMLEARCFATRTKKQLRSWDVCSDVVNGLISLAMRLVSTSDGVEISSKKRFFVEVPQVQPALYDQSSEEIRCELELMVDNFLSFSGVWATSPLQSQHDVKIDIEALAQNYADSTRILDTTWSRPPSFILLSIFADDENGIELARRISAEHHVEFLELDSLLDKCVSLSNDPQMLGDNSTSPSDHERELGTLGLKISDLRQKTLALPDALVLDVVAKTLSFYRREALVCPVENASTIPSNGCILLNFPRTQDESNCLERIIQADIKNERGEMIQDEVVPTASSSSWDCVVTICLNQLPLTDRMETDNILQDSDISTDTSLSSTLLSVQTPAANDEQRAKFESYWNETTRHIKVYPLGMHRDALAETIHMCIDIYTQESFRHTPALVECGIDSLPKELKEERNTRRESMNLIDRIMWMKATKEIALEDDTLIKLLRSLRKLDENLREHLRESMAKIRLSIQTISALVVTAEQELDRELFKSNESFQVLLNEMLTKCGDDILNQKLRERIFTKLEVCLGDAADVYRVAGNKTIEAFAQDSLSKVNSAIHSIYEQLPSICFVLRNYAMQKLEYLRTHLYRHIAFLSENTHDSKVVTLSKTLLEDTMNGVTKLGGGDKAGSPEPSCIAAEEMLQILDQLATEYSFNLNHESPAQQYAISETNVMTEEITRLFHHIAVLCEFAVRLRQKAEQLHASDLRRLQRIIEEDLYAIEQSIAKVMADVRAHGHAVWPIRNQEINSMSDIAARHPRVQKELFLTIAQLHALIHACYTWEQSNLLTANTHEGTRTINESFVALVIDVAEKEGFPYLWRDAGAVTAITLQECPTEGAISWRKIAWSVMCLQYTGIPSLKDILGLHERALLISAIKHQFNANGRHVTRDNYFMSRENFYLLPVWFEANNVNRSVSKKLQELIFLLFAIPSLDNETRHIDLIAMLLCWCIYPSSSFNVRRELEDFAPNSPRGMFRVFRLLRQHSAATSKTPTQCISSLFASFGLQPATQLTSILAKSLGSNSFVSFHQGCPTNLQSSFLLHNPLEALVESKR